MTARGRATRQALIAATIQVVGEVGYAHATTRAIADSAGVSEGTIYRHFPNKLALFFFALAESTRDVVNELGRLPTLAGTRSVEGNLLTTFQRLADAREHILPLELAVMSDPDLAAQRQKFSPDQLPGAPPRPTVVLAAYLRAEQELGRVRTDIDPDDAAEVLLVTLFGMSIHPPGADNGLNRRLLTAAIQMYLTPSSDASARQHRRHTPHDRQESE